MKSNEPEATWESNWRLVRRLWPSWKPADEIIKAIWFKNYDNDKTRQDILHDAIVDHRQYSDLYEPKFIELNDAYRLRLRTRITQATKAKEQKDVEESEQASQRRHRRRKEEIQSWTAERYEAARRRLVEFRPSLRSKSTDPETWTHGYTGLLFAADEIEREVS